MEENNQLIQCSKDFKWQIFDEKETPLLLRIPNSLLSEMRHEVELTLVVMGDASNGWTGWPSRQWQVVGITRDVSQKRLRERERERREREISMVCFPVHIQAGKHCRVHTK